MAHGLICGFGRGDLRALGADLRTPQPLSSASPLSYLTEDFSYCCQCICRPISGPLTLKAYYCGAATARVNVGDAAAFGTCGREFNVPFERRQSIHFRHEAGARREGYGHCQYPLSFTISTYFPGVGSEAAADAFSP